MLWVNTNIGCCVTRLLIFIFFLFTGCDLGRLPDKDISRANISYAELSFPNNGHQSPVLKLSQSQIDTLAEILSERIEVLSDVNSCYNLHLKLKDGGSVNYRTDGINFQGYDDSSDLPFSFSTKRNILTDVFKLIVINNCK